MRNITVSVDDEVYHRARMRASELRTSVSALVRKRLQELAGETTEFERLSERERDVIARLRSRRNGFSATRRLSRDEVHDRHALR